MTPHDDTLSAIAELIQSGQEADPILRGTIALLAAASSAGVGLRFIEAGVFSDGPWAGPSGPAVTAIPVHYNGELVAELVTTIHLETSARDVWEHVGVLIADYCLVGWDTGGEDWEP